MKLTAGAVVTVAGLLAAAGAVYFIKKKISLVGDAVDYALDLPVAAFNAVNNAVPPGITFDQKQPDGSIKKVTVTGAQIKKANANGANMGMVAWPSALSSVSPWYAGFGYEMDDWEADNPFGTDPSILNYDPAQAQKLLDFISGKSSVFDLIEPIKKWTMFGG